MATKKTTALTAEERLEKSLVPDNEQPYEVPENWCWVRMSDLYEINPKNLAADDTPASFVPMEKISPGMVSEFTYEVQPWSKAKKGHTQFADGDVAFAKISPCFENRKSMIVNGLENGIGAGTTELIILRQPLVNQSYTFWMIVDERFIQGGNQTYSGTVGQQRISMEYVRDYPVPLPSLAEQQRIVDRIEELFTDLDKAKEKAQRIIDSYEQRKAAIIHDALNGVLTEKWRNENGYAFDDWKNIVLGDYAGVQYGYTDSASSQPVGPRFLRITDIQNGRVNWTDVPYCKIDDNTKKNYAVKNGDIVVARIGATTGKSYLIVDDVDAVYASYLIRVSITNHDLNSEYLYKFMQSQEYWEQISELSSGIALPGVNGKKLQKLNLPLPTTEEQAEIVRILDELLADEQRIKEAAEETLAKIEFMKKSILADAFRGKLGTNDPSDRPAAELLKEILI